MQLKDILTFPVPETYSPTLLPYIEEAYDLIKKTVASKKNIFVSGDFDCDGICSTSSLVLGLREFLKDTSTKIIYRTPERVEGHNFPFKHINYAKKNNCGLIITVDSGSNDIEYLKRAQDNGLDVIVTDHHQITIDTSELTYPLVNPLLGYPDKHLCGAGIVYKFLQYGEEIYHEIPYALKRKIKQLTFLGTVADMVPIQRENYYFILEFRKLFGNNEKYTEENIIDKFVNLLDLNLNKGKSYSWNICPTINAAGRFNKSNNLIRLIINEETYDNIEKYLQEYIELNIRRKEYTQNWIKYIDATNSKEQYEKVLFLMNDDMPSGIKRLVVQNYVDENNIVVFGGGAGKDNTLSFSVTNKTNINFVKELQGRDYITNLGGHIGAFGVSYKKENHKEFVQEVINLVKDYKKEKKEAIALEVNKNLLPLAEELDSIIFGTAFSEPVFTDEVEVTNIFFIKGKHMSLTLSNGVKAIKWNYRNEDNTYKIGKNKLTFVLGVNEYMKNKELTLYLV